MGNRFLLWGRRVWLVLALNALVVLGMTLWLTSQHIANPSQRIAGGLAETGIPLNLYGAFFYSTTILSFLSFFIVALLIYLRRPKDGFAFFASIFLLNYGAATSYPQYVEFVQIYLHPPLWYAIPFLLANLFSWPFLIAFLVLFPDGQFQPRWTVYVSITSALVTTAWVFNPSAFTDFTTPFAIGGGIFVLLTVAAATYARVWRYRHYGSPLERQQTKWFVAAVFILALFSLLYFIPPLVFGVDMQPGTTGSLWSDFTATFTQIGFIFLPLAIGISILRYRLWDIDVLIRRTLTYAILSAFLVLIYFASIVGLQRVFTWLTNSNQNEIVTVISTLAIAALFVPLRNRIQAIIDQRFYRKKYDAQQVLTEFGNTLRDETDLEKLTARLVQVVNETMQPTSVSVWLRDTTGK